MYIVINDEPEVFVDLRYKNVKPNMYLISNYGTIKNKKRNTIRKITIDEGYHFIVLQTDEGLTINCRIHTLVAHHFIQKVDERNDSDQVNHMDGIRDHNYYKNLEWVTALENTRHAIFHGNRNSIFTEKDIHKVCSMMEKCKTVRETLKLLKIKKNKDKYARLIYGILAESMWADISCNYDFSSFIKQIHRDLSYERKVSIEMIHDGKSSSEIMDFLGIDGSDDRNKFSKFLYKLRKR